MAKHGKPSLARYLANLFSRLQWPHPLLSGYLVISALGKLGRRVEKYIYNEYF
jgi:hypothetical protein